MKRNLFNFVMTLCILITLSISPSYCFATENVNVSTTAPGTNESGGISVDSVSKPSSYIDLCDSKMSFSGSSLYSTLYTNKGFTGVTKIKANVENLYTTSSLTINVYKKNTFIDSKVYTYTISSGCTSYFEVSDLSSSSKYYLSFEAPSSFSGYITGE